MTIRRSLILSLVAFAVLAAHARAADAPASPRDVEHPFILWTADEAAAIRRRIESEPWAARALAKIREGDPETRRTVDNLFLYSVMGDESVVPVEQQLLIDFIGAPPFVEDPFHWQWHHVDHYEMALRYDALAPALPPHIVRSLDTTFRRLAIYGIETEPLREWENYPRMASHTMCALVTRDRRVIRGIFEAPGGLKSYFDSLIDGHFSPGAGNPAQKMLGEIMLWCRAVRRLGMDDIGFGYRSPSGIGLKEFLQGIWMLGDPRTDIPGGMPFYGRYAASPTWRAGGMAYRAAGHEGLSDVLRAPIVLGRLPDGTGGPYGWWTGGTGIKAYSVFQQGGARMQLDSVFEIAHGVWPDAGFDYFLAQMRGPGEDRYTPSIYWGLEPIDASKVTPPAVESHVYPQRGVAILRAEEGPGYWASPAPEASLQLAGGRGRGGSGTQLSILGLHAFNRPLYRFDWDPGGFGRERFWGAAARSASTVTVDNLCFDEVKTIHGPEQRARWPQPLGVVPVRSHFAPLAKFVAVRAGPTEVRETTEDGASVTRTATLYPGVEMQRALVLTREYLFDAFRVASEEPHTYHWLVHAFGEAAPEEPDAWAATDELDRTLGDVGPGAYNFLDQRFRDTGGKAWSMRAIQTCAREDPAESRLGAAWYAHRIGVRVTMLGEDGTRAYFAKTPDLSVRRRVHRERPPDPGLRYRLPGRDKDYDTGDHAITELEILPADGELPAPEPEEAEPEAPDEPEVTVDGPGREAGGVSIIAARTCPATTFVALHEPFENGSPRIRAFRRIAESKDAMAVAVGGAGEPVNDRVLLALGDRAAEPVTLEGGGERYTFVGYAFVRIGAGRVDVEGDLREMRLPVEGRPQLFVEGKPAEAKVEGGVMSFSR